MSGQSNIKKNLIVFDLGGDQQSIIANKYQATLLKSFKNPEGGENLESCLLIDGYQNDKKDNLALVLKELIKGVMLEVEMDEQNKTAKEDFEKLASIQKEIDSELKESEEQQDRILEKYRQKSSRWRFFPFRGAGVGWGKAIVQVGSKYFALRRSLAMLSAGEAFPGF